MSLIVKIAKYTFFGTISCFNYSVISLVSQEVQSKFLACFKSNTWDIENTLLTTEWRDYNNPPLLMKALFFNDIIIQIKSHIVGIYPQVRSAANRKVELWAWFTLREVPDNRLKMNLETIGVQRYETSIHCNPFCGTRRRFSASRFTSWFLWFLTPTVYHLSYLCHIYTTKGGNKAQSRRKLHQKISNIVSAKKNLEEGREARNSTLKLMAICRVLVDTCVCFL